MAKRLIVALGILGAFSLGAGGGIWAQAFLLPYFSSHPMFKNLQFVKEWNERTTVIREVQEITITKEEGVIRTVEAAQKAVVGIRATNINTVLNGSGLILTSDGFIITLAEVVPVGYTATVYLKEGESIDAQVLKRDSKENLVILKIEESNLSTVGFATRSAAKSGSDVIMVAKSLEAGELVRIVQKGTVRTEGAHTIRTNIFDKSTLQGSPLFTLEGQVVGLSTFEPNGRLVAISASTLRDFSGF